MPASARSFVVASALVAAALVAAADARADVPIPPIARVTDLTGTLAASDQRTLADKLAAFEQRKGSQIAVLVVPTTAPEVVEQYAIRVADAWKLGRKGVDDGALLVVATDDRTLRIEVGYGLEGVLNDATAKRIIDEIIVPRFRAGDFAGGIQAGVDRMIAVVDGEPLPPPPRATWEDRHRGRDWFPLFGFGFLLSMMAGGVLRRMIGRLPAATLVGAAVGLLFWVFLGWLFAALVFAIFAFVATLVGSSMPTGPGPRRGWYGGGGGWSGGGGGGGGFSGGGGGFGGGGASGRW